MVLLSSLLTLTIWTLGFPGADSKTANGVVPCGTLVSQLKAINETSVLIEALGPERALSTLYTAYIQQGNPLAEELLRVVLRKRKVADEALDNVSTWLVDEVDQKNPNLSSKDAFKRSLQHQRSVGNTTFPKDSFVDFYTERNAHFVRWIAKVINRSPESAKDWQNLTAYSLLIDAKEQFGIERGSGVYLFANGSMRHEVYLINVGHRQQAIAYFERIAQRTPVVAEQLKERYTGTQLEKDLTAARALLDDNKSRQPNVPEGQAWVENTTKFIGIIHNIEMMLLDGIIQTLKDSCATNGTNIVQNTR